MQSPARSRRGAGADGFPAYTARFVGTVLFHFFTSGAGWLAGAYEAGAAAYLVKDALMAQAMRNKEIATVLGLSEQTVHAHIKNIFLKLQVSDRIAAINLARRYGLISTH